MSVTDELLENAEQYADASTRATCRFRRPRRSQWWRAWTRGSTRRRCSGSSEGDAHVIRNAGGVVTDDEIRSLAISQRLLGTEEIILIHHTDCGMLTFTDEEFTRAARGRHGHQAAVGRRALRRPRGRRARVDRAHPASPFIPNKDSVRGFVYDVETRPPATRSSTD